MKQEAPTSISRSSSQEWDYEQEYLVDTCLTAQDRYKKVLEYFRIEY